MEGSASVSDTCEEELAEGLLLAVAVEFVPPEVVLEL